MRFSLDNEIEGAELTVDNVQNEVSYFSVMTDKRTTRAYIADQDGSSAIVITATLAAEADIDLVALVGVSGFSSATVVLKYLTATVATQAVTLSTPVQQTYMVAEFASVEADEIEITLENVGDGETIAIGYLFAGLLSDDLTIANEALNYRIVSAYPRNITRAGVPLTSQSYLVAAVNLALAELPFSELREILVTIATVGYASPRIWYFDESCILTGEALFGILDSDQQQIDPTYYQPGEEARATATLGLQEVF